MPTSLLMLIILSASYRIATATSLQFVDRLIPTRQYSLSPSGNLLLVSEPTEHRAARRQKLMVRPVTPSGLGPTYRIPFDIAVQEVQWAPRADTDELIGLGEARLYRTEVRSTHPQVITAPVREVIFPPKFSEIAIRRFPQQTHHRAIITAVDRGTGSRGVYGCDIYSVKGIRCHLIGLYGNGIERYFFGRRDDLVARARWNNVNPRLVDFQVYNPESPSPWRTSFSYDPTATLLRILASPDEHGHVLVLSNRQSDRIVLARLNIDNGHETVIAKHKYDVDELFQNTYTREVLAASSSVDFPKVTFLNTLLEKRLEKLLRDTRRPLKLELLSTDSLNRRFIVRIRNARIGFATVLLHASGQVELLDRSKPPQDDDLYKTYVAPEPILITTDEGPSLRGLLTLPTDGSAPFPFVIMIHGGPRKHYRWHMHPLVQRLASLGIAALQLNYRGSSGYGKAYERFVLVNHDPFESVARDVELAYEWLVSSGVGEPGQAGLWGESFGTTVAVQVAAKKPDRYPVVVMLGGLFDFAMYLDYVRDSAFGRELVIRGWYRYLGVENAEAILRRTAGINPCSLAGGFQSATLMFAPVLDRITHPDQSLAFHDELRARGLKPRLKILLRDGQGHRLTSRRHVVSYMAETADFFYKKLVTEPDFHRNERRSAGGSRRDSVYKCLSPRRSLRDVLTGK